MLKIDLTDKHGAILCGQNIALTKEDMALPVARLIQRYFEPAIQVIVNQYAGLTEDQKRSVESRR